MKKESIPSYTSTTLTAKEFLVLRSYALGMSEQQLCKLIEVNPLKFLKIKKDLMQKLAVQNMYTAVRKGFELRLLDPINYMDEEIKSKTLDFLEKHESDFLMTRDVAGNPLWRYYPLLLKYHTISLETNAKTKSRNGKIKKSHRSGIKDLHLRHKALL